MALEDALKEVFAAFGSPDIDFGEVFGIDEKVYDLIGVWDEVNGVDDLCVCAVETIGDSDDGAECFDDASVVGLEGHEFAVLSFGLGTAVVSGGVGDDGDLSGGEAAEIAVDDEVVGVFVVFGVVHEVADIAEDRGGLNEFAVFGCEDVGLRLAEELRELIEDGGCE